MSECASEVAEPQTGKGKKMFLFTFAWPLQFACANWAVKAAGNNVKSYSNSIIATATYVCACAWVVISECVHVCYVGVCANACCLLCMGRQPPRCPLLRLPWQFSYCCCYVLRFVQIVNQNIDSLYTFNICFCCISSVWPCVVSACFAFAAILNIIFV